MKCTLYVYVYISKISAHKYLETLNFLFLPIRSFIPHDLSCSLPRLAPCSRLLAIRPSYHLTPGVRLPLESRGHPQSS